MPYPLTPRSIEQNLGNITQLPSLDNLTGLPDFDWVARQVLEPPTYNFFRTGAGGEWSYRNNLEIYGRVTARPRVMKDVSNTASTLPTSILGRNYSAPFYIAPFGRAGLGNPDEGEFGLMQGAADEDLLYIMGGDTSTPMEDLAASRVSNDSYDQVIWKQAFLDETNDTATIELFRGIESVGATAIVFTIDTAADPRRHRQARFAVPGAYTAFNGYTWEYYDKVKTLTELPIVLKGIQTYEDALLAVEHGAPAIMLSNHGARNLDTAPSPLEIAFEIHKNAPEVFTQTEVFADSGVRYGGDVLKLLSLGVRAVGIGRPFVYANMYGAEGVRKASQLLKAEIANDAAHLGLPNIHDVSPDHFKWQPNFWYS